jgi:hypothetical protein
MARKSPRERIKERARETIKERTRESSEFATAPFLISPVTRPIAAPIRRVFPNTVDAIVDSGLLDNAIDREIAKFGRRYDLQGRPREVQGPVFQQEPAPMTREEQLEAVISVAKQLGTDPEMVREVEKLAKATGTEKQFESGREVIRRSRQFDLQNLLPRMYENRPMRKRTRKKTKTDKNMSKALRMANDRLRTKKGKLRKGKTQADVMRLAHRLRKKM